MAMTVGQKLSYEANGFLIVREALDPELLASVQAASARAEDVWRSDETLPGSRGAALNQVQAIMEYDDVLLNLLWNPVMLPLVRDALGDDLQMIDHDYFITPPHTPHTHAGWHFDVGLTGVYNPRSVMMVKVFYLLTDVNEDSGGTALIPGSHRFLPDTPLPTGNPREAEGVTQMTGKAGDAYLFNGRCYHAAVNNDSDNARRVLIYNYGHRWMKMWPGYEPSEALMAKAVTPMQKQLLGMSPAYGSDVAMLD